jgi:hypothetical protein
LIISSHYSPRVLPVLADLVDTEIDRVQDLTSTLALNRTKIEEVGRDGIVSWRSALPTVTVNCKQFEYGNMEFFRQLANKGPSVSQINYTDYRTGKFDIAGYTTDDNGTVLGTVWYNNLRLSGFNFNIGDPEAVIERNFTFVGDNEILLENNNKYLIRQRGVIASTGNNQTITITSPTPVADPDNSGRFLFKVVKCTGGTCTELTHGTQWSYNGSGTLTINGSSTAGDIIWYWYSASTYSGSSTFVNNDTDVGAITADSVTIWLVSQTHVSRLQSVSVDTSFERKDIREIGTVDVVSTGVKTITNNVTLGRIIESYTIEEALRGKIGVSYGKIDPKRFGSGMSLVIKVYSDNTKQTFKMGYKFTDLAPISRDTGTPVADYITAGVQLSGETAFVTTVEAIL